MYHGILKLRSLLELFIIKGLYSLCTFLASRRMRWEKHIARMRERTGVHRVLLEKPEGKRPLERSIRRWADNVKIDLQEVRYEDMD